MIRSEVQRRSDSADEVAPAEAFRCLENGKRRAFKKDTAPWCTAGGRSHCLDVPTGAVDCARGTSAIEEVPVARRGARRRRRRVHREGRRSGAAASVQPKQAGAVKHGRDLDEVLPQPIHDAVVGMYDLAEGVVANLWYHPSSARTAPEQCHSGENPLNDEVGIVRGITGHIRPYRFNILDGLRCPDDSGHRRSRLFTSL